MKKLLVMIISMVLVISSVSVESLSAELPSHWAVEEVDAAVKGGLVPVALQSEYQGLITRAEYVLIGLEIIEDLGIEVSVRYDYPFDDIRGNNYEEEIVKAYNAGLINGYGDGLFRPDNVISREEIATLVANLVRIIDPIRNMWVDKGSIEYADDDLIADWARNNINYCYDNGIMNGVGKNGRLLDYMDPKGSATREQAILLLYRLSKTEGIYSELPYATIPLISDIPGAGGTTLALIDFSASVGEVIADNIYDFQSKSYVGVTSIDATSVELQHKDNSVLWYFNGTFLDVQLNLYNLDNLVMVNEFIELVNLSYPDKEIRSLIMDSIEALQDDQTYYMSEDLGDDLVLKIFADEIVNSNDGVELVEYRFKVVDETWKE